MNYLVVLYYNGRFLRLVDEEALFWGEYMFEEEIFSIIRTHVVTTVLSFL